MSQNSIKIQFSGMCWPVKAYSLKTLANQKEPSLEIVRFPSDFPTQNPFGIFRLENFWHFFDENLTSLFLSLMLVMVKIFLLKNLQFWDFFWLISQKNKYFNHFPQWLLFNFLCINWCRIDSLKFIFLITFRLSS